MSNFQKDVQLLTDLQELISDAERTPKGVTIRARKESA